MLQSLPPPEPPGQLIVVTGEPLSVPAGERSYPAEILGRSELENAARHQLDEILKQVPGLQLFRRSDSTSGHPTSQGVTLRALGGNASSRALLVLDGVPQADPFGGWVNWPAYDAAGLSQVKILHGGGNVGFGPGAVAGLIEMRSLTQRDFNASLEAGSRQSLYGHAYLGEAAGGGMVTADLQAGRSDGFVPVTKETRGLVDRPAPYNEASLRMRWVAPIGDKVEAQLAGLGFVDKRDRGIPFTENRTRGADASFRAVGRGSWQWVLLGYGQWRNLRSSFASVDDERLTATRVSLQDKVPSRAFGGGFEIRPPHGSDIDLRMGTDFRLMDGESRELAGYVEGEPTRRRIAGGDTSTLGIFAEASVSRGSFMLSGAARIDHWQIKNGKLVERMLATDSTTRNDRFPDRDGWQPTLRLAAQAEMARGLDVRLAAYRAWRMPTLNELFRPFRVGADATAANPLLDVEKLRGIEAGADLRRGIFDMSLTLFANRLRGAIANVTLGQGPGIFPGVGFVAGEYRQRENLDAIRVRGFETSAGIRNGTWSLRLGASYSDARVVADGSAAVLDGLRPAQTPKITVTGSVGWDRENRSASLSVRHVSAQYEDDLNRRRLKPATTIDGFLAWPFAGRFQLFWRGQNLLGSRVEAGISDDGTIERAAPRTFWIGVRLMASRHDLPMAPQPQ